MLKFSYLRSLTSPVLLSADHDQKLRQAFGRCAEERYRADGAKVVSQYYGQNGCFHCDCRPDAERAPLLFLVTGNHIRREEKVGRKGTPHHDTCDFAYEPDEQKRLVRTWQRFRPNERLLKLALDFGDDDQQSSPTISFVSTRSRAPRLARILFNLLHEAKLDRLYSSEDLCGCNEEQNENLLRAAVKFFVTPDRSLLDWIATSLPEFYELKRRLEAKPAGWNRPCGLFIEAFGKIENKTLYPYRSDKKPIKVVGDLAVYGEKDQLRRPPYLVIGSPPHAVIEYDIFKREMRPETFDEQFCQKVCAAILEKCPGPE